jgi:hypothetical protein
MDRSTIIPVVREGRIFPSIIVKSMRPMWSAWGRNKGVAMKIHNIFRLPHKTMLDHYLNEDNDPPTWPKLPREPVLALEYGHGDYGVLNPERTPLEQDLVKANRGSNFGPELIYVLRLLKLPELWVVHSEYDNVILVFDINPKEMFAALTPQIF